MHTKEQTPQETQRETRSNKSQAKHADDTHKVTILKPRDNNLELILSFFWVSRRPVFSSTGALMNPLRTNTLIYPNLQWHLRRKGTPKRAPDMQRTSKAPPNGCHGVRKRNKSATTQIYRNLYFGRAYNVLNGVSWLGGVLDPTNTTSKTCEYDQSYQSLEKRKHEIVNKNNRCFVPLICVCCMGRAMFCHLHMPQTIS